MLQKTFLTVWLCCYYFCHIFSFTGYIYNRKEKFRFKKKKIVTSGGNWKPITSIKEMIGLMSFGRGVKCYNCK